MSKFKGITHIFAAGAAGIGALLEKQAVRDALISFLKAYPHASVATLAATFIMAVYHDSK